jgi:hypothetical protein
MKKGSRVSWMYDGARTTGVVQSVAKSNRVSIKTKNGGTVTRVGSADDPIVRIKSDVTNNTVLKKRSELSPAKKAKKK